MIEVVVIPDERKIVIVTSSGLKKNFEWSDLLACKTYLSKLSSEIGAVYVVQTFTHLALSIYEILKAERLPVNLVNLPENLLRTLKQLKLSDKLPFNTEELGFLVTIFETIRKNVVNYIPDYTLRNLARSIYKVFDSLSQLGSSVRITAAKIFPYLQVVRPYQENFAGILNNWNDKSYAIRDLAYTLLSYLWSEFAKLDLAILENFDKSETFATLPITSTLYYMYEKNVVPDKKFYALVDLWTWLQTFMDENSNEIRNFANKVFGQEIEAAIQAQKIDGLWPSSNDFNVNVMQHLANELQTSFHIFLQLERSSYIYADNNPIFKCVLTQVRHIFDIYSFTLLFAVLDNPKKKFDNNVDRIMRYLDLFSAKPKVDGLNLAAHQALKRKLNRLQQIFGDLPDEIVLRKAIQFLISAWDDCQHLKTSDKLSLEGVL